MGSHTGHPAFTQARDMASSPDAPPSSSPQVPIRLTVSSGPEAPLPPSTRPNWRARPAPSPARSAEAPPSVTPRVEAPASTPGLALEALEALSGFLACAQVSASGEVGEVRGRVESAALRGALKELMSSWAAAGYDAPEEVALTTGEVTLLCKRASAQSDYVALLLRRAEGNEALARLVLGEVAQP